MYYLLDNRWFFAYIVGDGITVKQNNKTIECKNGKKYNLLKGVPFSVEADDQYSVTYVVDIIYGTNTNVEYNSLEDEYTAFTNIVISIE